MCGNPVSQEELVHQMCVCVCVLNSTGYNSAALCIHMLYFLPLIGNKKTQKAFAYLWHENLPKVPAAQ